MRLGKKDYRYDKRTLTLTPDLVDTTVTIPEVWDGDKNKTPFPISSWGNDAWGDCVKAGQVNQSLRLERIERRVTLSVSPADVVEEYKMECQREFGVRPVLAGDAHDGGLIMLENNRNWRKVGWDVKLGPKAKKKTTLKIAAFAYLSPKDHGMLRRGAYFMRGVQLGLSLPQTAAVQWSQGRPWDVPGGNDPQSQPGSWGGHCVYLIAYDKDGIEVWTWGKRQYVTNAFMDRYADEAWVVVDEWDGAPTKYLNVDAMKQHLVDVGATVVN